MELFTFIRMGGARERITVIELGRGVRDALSSFDARRARCYLPRDRHKLMGVVEAAFGDLRPFNRVVRSIFRERTEEQPPVEVMEVSVACGPEVP